MSSTGDGSLACPGDFMRVGPKCLPLPLPGLLLLVLFGFYGFVSFCFFFIFWAFSGRCPNTCFWSCCYLVLLLMLGLWFGWGCWCEGCALSFLGVTVVLGLGCVVVCVARLLSLLLVLAGWVPPLVP